LEPVMAAIGTIFLFLIGFAALNFIEFKRID
jgi:hypothetical protein